MLPILYRSRRDSRAAITDEKLKLLFKLIFSYNNNITINKEPLKKI